MVLIGSELLSPSTCSCGCGSLQTGCERPPATGLLATFAKTCACKLAWTSLVVLARVSACAYSLLALSCMLLLHAAVLTREMFACM